MINEQHIIQFKYTSDLYIRSGINKEFYICEYRSSDGEYVIYTRIYYNYLNIFSIMDSKIKYDYIFNLSNMLYKLHTKDYYSKIHQNKVLI